LISFQLFRIKVYLPEQTNIHNLDSEPTEVLVRTIESLPSAKLRRGFIWHIGNVTAFDAHAYYFRLGKISKEPAEVYENGAFFDAPYNIAPYTHVILDATLELCGIAHKTSLSGSASQIANQLDRLLNRSDKAKLFEADFEIKSLEDPTEFLEYLRQAERIKKFRLSFSKPNPVDTEKDFVQPMERLLRKSNGLRGATELRGKDLEPETLEELTRSAAATGENASAEIVIPGNDKTVTKRLKDSVVNIQMAEVDGIDDKRQLLSMMRDKYRQVREMLNSENQ